MGHIQGYTCWYQTTSEYKETCSLFLLVVWFWLPWLLLILVFMWMNKTGHFVLFQQEMPAHLPAVEKPALRPAFQPVGSSRDLSPIFAVLWQLQHAQLLRQLHLPQQQQPALQ